MADKKNQGLREVTISLGGSWGDVVATRDTNDGDFSISLGDKKVSVSPENLAIAKVCAEEGNSVFAIAILRL